MRHFRTTFLILPSTAVWAYIIIQMNLLERIQDILTWENVIQLCLLERILFKIYLLGRIFVKYTYLREYYPNIFTWENIIEIYLLERIQFKNGDDDEVAVRGSIWEIFEGNLVEIGERFGSAATLMQKRWLCLTSIWIQMKNLIIFWNFIYLLLLGVHRVIMLQKKWLNLWVSEFVINQRVWKRFAQV